MELKAINHLSLVVENLEKSREFYGKFLGFTKHPSVKGWYLMSPSNVNLHLIEIEGTIVPSESDYHHYYRHCALEVSSLQAIALEAMNLGIDMFMMDDEGNEEPVTSSEKPISFGLMTIFARDPDGNLWEFIEHGVSWHQLWE